MPTRYPVGGRMILEYANSSARYQLALSVAPFAATPLPGTGEYAYTGEGWKHPTELGVVATYESFSHVWAPYYQADWVLSLIGLWRFSGTDLVTIDPLPPAPNFLGTSGLRNVLDPAMRRGFSFISALGNKQRIRLFCPSGTSGGIRTTVTPDGGGFDDRDRAFVAYLASPDSGVLCWDGLNMPPSAWVYMRFEPRPQVASTEPLAGDYIVSG